MKLTTASRPLSFSYVGLTIIATAAVAGAIVVPLSRRASTSWLTRDGADVKRSASAQPVTTLHDPPQPSGDFNVWQVVFSRGDYIYAKELASGKQTKLVRSDWGEISPDGSKLLFKSGSADKWNWEDPRPMQLFDVATKRVEELSSIAELDPLEVCWSHDGSSIAFLTSQAGPGTAIGVLNVMSGQWKLIYRRPDLVLSQGEGPLTLNSWAANNESVILHSLDFVYQVNLDGEVIWKLSIGEFNISSATRFSLSSDNKLLLFDNYRDGGEHDPVNSVVSILEIASGKITAVTPGTVSARDPRWFGSDNKILFECLGRREGPPYRPHLCTINADGSGLTRLIDNAEDASISFDNKLAHLKTVRTVR